MIPLLTSHLPALHGFCTRIGGVSLGSYSSLNCGLHGRDDASHVSENRARAVAAIGGCSDRLVGLKQVHGARVITVSNMPEAHVPPEADALVTDMPGLALGIITADCAPVLFTDTHGRVVGAAHAGWRGALSGVLEATIDAMRALGAERIMATIGPCIHQPSYEVASDMRDSITSRNPEDDRFFKAGNPARWQFDLPGYCAARLAAVGIGTMVMMDDTYAEESRFFSHRRRMKRAEGTGGHQISVIMSQA